MKFFDRKKEISLLQDIKRQSLMNAQFTVLTGRRRIGKTSLVMKAYETDLPVYFFVSRKSEKELCQGFMSELQSKLNITLPGEVSSFAELFEFVMRLSRQQAITLFIDEFQDFQLINPSIFSDMQRIWDLNKENAHINLIVAGSINSLMNKIFRDNKEPLYQRETRTIKLRPFTPQVIKEILNYYNSDYTKEDLLALYSLTGGVAKYIELLMDNGMTTKSAMLNFIIRDGSTFLDEGKVMLIGEFGKEYGTYFSILSAIARGYNTRAQIENITGSAISGYLTRLEGDYELIRKHQPILEKSANKGVRYTLRDNFLIFWFRFIFKYNYMLEIGAYNKLRSLIERDYDVFTGWMLERYFRDKMIESEQFTRIGSWWDRKGENEIDIVAIDEIEEQITFAEVKRNAEKINPALVDDKIRVLLSTEKSLASFTRKVLYLSMTDM